MSSSSRKRGHRTPSPGRGGSPFPSRGGHRSRQAEAQAQEERELEKQHSPPAPGYKQPLLIRPSTRIPKADDDYSDAVKYRLSRTPSPASTPSPTSSKDKFEANFPSLVETSGGRIDTRESPEASAVVQQGVCSRPAGSLSDDQLKETFKHLLNSSGKISPDSRSHYQIMASVNVELKKMVLEINFEDLLTAEYIALATEITKRAAANPTHSWLQPVVREFLNSQFKLSRKDQMKLGFCFSNQPLSITPLPAIKTEDVSMVQSIYDGKENIVRTTKTGRLVYASVINHALAVQRTGRSYDGKFQEKDFYMIAYSGKSKLRCLILAPTIICLQDPRPKVKDMQQIDAILSERYSIGGLYPPFFSDLRSDLSELTARKMKETGILSILPFHYAFMPPEAWAFLIWKVHRLIKQLKSSGSNFSSVFSERLVPMGDDWRPLLKESKDDVLKGVYNHENNLAVDKFDNNLQGAVDCNRHLMEHAHNHPKGCPVRVRSKDENELFAAVKMPRVIPRLIGLLFKTRKMEFEKELGEVYADYCKLLHDAEQYEMQWSAPRTD